MASTMFDLPEPLGPTTTVMPRGNSNRVRSAKLLKPTSSRALSMVKRLSLAEHEVVPVRENAEIRRGPGHLRTTQFSTPELIVAA